MSAPRWAGLSHAELRRMVASGPGPSASAGAERAWRDAAQALDDVRRELTGRTSALPTTWSGTTADGLSGALTTLAGWTGTAATEATKTADGLATQASLAAELRTRMPAAPAPAPPEVAPAGAAVLGDWAAADDDAANSGSRAGELMQRYCDDTDAVGVAFRGWAPPPTVIRDGTGPVASGTGSDARGSGTVPPLGPGSWSSPGPDAPAGAGSPVHSAAVEVAIPAAAGAAVIGAAFAGVAVAAGPGAATGAPVGVTGGRTRDGAGARPGGFDPATSNGRRGPVGADPDDGTDPGPGLTATVIGGGSLAGSAVLVGAAVRRDPGRGAGGRAEDGAAPAGDDGTADGPDPAHGHGHGGEGSGPAHRGDDRSGAPSDGGHCGGGPPSGAEHRAPSGAGRTSGTRAQSGDPAAQAPGATITDLSRGAGADPTGASPAGAGHPGPGHPATAVAGSAPASHPTGPGAPGADGGGPHATNGHATGPAPGCVDGTGRAAVNTAVHAGPVLTTAPGASPDPGTPGPLPESRTPAPDGRPLGAQGPGTPPPARSPITDHPVGSHHSPYPAATGPVPPAHAPVSTAAATPVAPGYDGRLPAWRAVAGAVSPDDRYESPQTADGDDVLRPEQRWRGRG